MSFDLDKILDRIDIVNNDEYHTIQDNKPNDLHDIGHLKNLEFWSEMEARKKSRNLEVAKKVHDLIRSVKKQTLDDQSELLDRFKELLDL